METLVGVLSLGCCGAMFAGVAWLRARQRRADAAAPLALCHGCRRMVPATTLERWLERNEPLLLCAACHPEGTDDVVL